MDFLAVLAIPIYISALIAAVVVLVAIILH